MRVFFGIILGVALTVGIAFISDNWATTSPSTTGGPTVAHRNMVNWEVVEERTRLAQERLRAAWSKLSHKAAS